MLQFDYMSKFSQGRMRALVFVMLMFAVMLQPVIAAPGSEQNLADLIVQSDRILMGTVDKVSDGFTEQGVPYTEINLNVTECLKGDDTRQYMFRQFGLVDSAENDLVTDYPGLSPHGFVQWMSGESVLVFLHQPARWTGLQTTVGLSQGKLRQVKDQFKGEDSLSYLFENLVVEASDLTQDQINMLHNTTLEVNAGSLLALVRRAVDENWVEKGVMRHAN